MTTLLVVLMVGVAVMLLVKAAGGLPAGGGSGGIAGLLMESMRANVANGVPLRSFRYDPSTGEVHATYGEAPTPPRDLFADEMFDRMRND